MSRLAESMQALRVCVPVHAFPVSGGTRAFLAGVAQVTEGRWEIEYLTHVQGANPDGITIQSFGRRWTTPWQFPFVLLYSLAGLWKLLWLRRSGKKYDLLLPQDGVFTGAFAALAGKVTGTRVVCIDHGNLTLLWDRAYYEERRRGLEQKSWPWLARMLARLLFVGYLPTLRLLARIAARRIEHYIIPGIEGDGTEEVCARLGIAPERITRIGSMIDTSKYAPASKEADEVVVALVCRLAPEKGIGIALAALEEVAERMSREEWRRVRIVIAGDGPLRAEVEQIIKERGLSEQCRMWGEATSEQVRELLGMSDIFLYTSVRGACLSMAVLEAMASGCAVIATRRPPSNEQLLGEGRGIVIEAENVGETARALHLLLKGEELRKNMGERARAYARKRHSPASFQDVLLRACERDAAIQERREKVEGLV